MGLGQAGHRGARSGLMAPKGKQAQDIREERFVLEYLKDFDAARAYQAAGWKGTGNGASVSGGRVLRRPRVQELLRQQSGKMLSKAELSVERVIEELRRLSFSDVRTLFDEHGNLRPLHDLTPEQSSAIGALEVVKRNLTAGDGQSDTIIKIKCWDKPKSLELLAKYFGILKEKVEITGDWDKIAARLASARTRSDDR